jgi:hypothetical protein
MSKFSIKKVNTGMYRDYAFAECDVYLSSVKVMTFADDGRSCGQHYQFESQSAKNAVLAHITEDKIEDMINELVNEYDLMQVVKKRQAEGVIYATKEQVKEGTFQRATWSGHTILTIKRQNRMDIISDKVNGLLAEGKIILNLDYLVKQGVTV